MRLEEFQEQIEIVNSNNIVEMGDIYDTAVNYFEWFLEM